AMVHPDSVDLVRQRGEARLAGDNVLQRYEYKIKTKQGVTRWLDFSSSPILFEGHQALLCVAMDVTERKRAERLQAALYRISERSNSAQDLDQLYAAIHGIIGELMYADNFYIALLDSDKKQLSFPHFVDTLDPQAETRDLGRGLTEYVIRTGSPVLAD